MTTPPPFPPTHTHTFKHTRTHMLIQKVTTRPLGTEVIMLLNDCVLVTLSNYLSPGEQYHTHTHTQTRAPSPCMTMTTMSRRGCQILRRCLALFNLPPAERRERGEKLWFVPPLPGRGAATRSRSNLIDRWRLQTRSVSTRLHQMQMGVYTIKRTSRTRTSEGLIVSSGLSA